MVMEDQNGVRSIASEANIKSDAPAVTTTHFSSTRNVDTKGLDFSFSTNYDSNIVGYKLYAKLNGVDEKAYGIGNDPLISKITVTRAQIAAAMSDRQNS